MRSVPAEMTAGVLTKVREIQFELWPVPVPGPDEVLVKMRMVGVCGSDVHWYADGKLGGATVTEALVLGHEAAGVVVQVTFLLAVNHREGPIGHMCDVLLPSQSCPSVTPEPKVFVYHASA